MMTTTSKKFFRTMFRGALPRFLSSTALACAVLTGCTSVEDEELPPDEEVRDILFEQPEVTALLDTFQSEGCPVLAGDPLILESNAPEARYYAMGLQETCYDGDIPRQVSLGVVGFDANFRVLFATGMHSAIEYDSVEYDSLISNPSAFDEDVMPEIDAVHHKAYRFDAGELVEMERQEWFDYLRSLNTQVKAQLSNEGGNTMVALRTATSDPLVDVLVDAPLAALSSDDPCRDNVGTCAQCLACRLTNEDRNWCEDDYEENDIAVHAACRSGVDVAYGIAALRGVSFLEASPGELYDACGDACSLDRCDRRTNVLEWWTGRGYDEDCGDDHTCKEIRWTQYRDDKTKKLDVCCPDGQDCTQYLGFDD